MGYYFDVAGTTIGTNLPIIKKVKEEVTKFIISTNELEKHFFGFKGEVTQPLFITGNDSFEEAVPVFIHPIRVDVGGVSYMVSDLRSVYDPKDFEIKNNVEYSYIVSRNLLSCSWLDGHVNVFRDDMDLVGMVFCAWVADTVSKRFLLEPSEQSNLMIALLFYWLTLFEKEISDTTKDLAVVRAVKWFKLPATYCYAVLDRVERVENMEDLCGMLFKASGNSRLENLNSGILVTILGNTWYSINAKELTAVSLEHVPTFTSLVYASVTEKNFRTSIIAKISERYGKQGYGELFVRKYNELVNNYTKG